MDHGIVLSAIYPEIITNCSQMVCRLNEVARQQLYTCVEIYFSGTKLEEEEINRTLSDLNLRLVYLAGFPMKENRTDITAKEDEARKRSVQYVCELYEHAKTLGAKKMLIVSGPDWKVREEKEILQQARKSFDELDLYADDDGPEITVEYFPVVREPYLALGSTDLMAHIFEGKNYRHIGITFDTSHVAQLQEDMIESFTKVCQWTHHLHFANSMSAYKEHPLYGDRHPLFSLENGDYSLEQMKKNYLKLLNKGLLQNIDIGSMEVISRGEEDWYYRKTAEEAISLWS